MSQLPIHESIQNLYGMIADATSEVQIPACCNAGNTVTATAGYSQHLYDTEALAELPAGVINLSLGCGTPVTFAHLQAGETVLDLGSGGGIDCFLAAKQVGPLGMVIGIDMTPAMLAKANVHKQKMGLSNVDFRFGMIEALPVQNSSVDVIISNCVINLAPDKSLVFREAFRVLKPGGRLAISDIVTEGDFSPELRAQADKWAECISGALDVTAYIGMIRDAGFVDIRVVDKFDADRIVRREDGMPRIFSASILAQKP